MLFGQRLGVGVVAEPTGRIGDRFVDAFVIRAVERDTGAAGIDQSLDIVLQRTADNVLRAERVDAVELFPRAPNSGLGRNVKNNVDVPASVADGLSIAKIASDRLHAEPIECRVFSATESANAVPPRNQLFNDVQAEESAGAGNQSIQGISGLI